MRASQGLNGPSGTRWSIAYKQRPGNEDAYGCFTGGVQSMRNHASKSRRHNNEKPYKGNVNASRPSFLRALALSPQSRFFSDENGREVAKSLTAQLVR